MATNDFFLSFGSDADLFGQKLKKDLAGSREAIDGLAEALLNYDQKLASARNANSPLGNLFSSLDRVSERFSSVTSEFATALDKAVGTIGNLKVELSELITSVNSITGRRRTTKERDAAAIAAVDPEDVAAAGRARKLLADLNADKAAKSLSAIADINHRIATEAPNTVAGLKGVVTQLNALAAAAEKAGGYVFVGGHTGPAVSVPGGSEGHAADPVPSPTPGGAPVIRKPETLAERRQVLQDDLEKRTQAQIDAAAARVAAERASRNAIIDNQAEKIRDRPLPSAVGEDPFQKKAASEAREKARQLQQSQLSSLEATRSAFNSKNDEEAARTAAAAEDIRKQADVLKAAIGEYTAEEVGLAGKLLTAFDGAVDELEKGSRKALDLLLRNAEAGGSFTGQAKNAGVGGEAIPGVIASNRTGTEKVARLTGLLSHAGGLTPKDLEALGPAVNTGNEVQDAIHQLATEQIGELLKSRPDFKRAETPANGIFRSRLTGFDQQIIKILGAHTPESLHASQVGLAADDPNRYTFEEVQKLVQGALLREEERKNSIESIQRRDFTRFNGGERANQASRILEQQGQGALDTNSFTALQSLIAQGHNKIPLPGPGDDRASYQLQVEARKKFLAARSEISKALKENPEADLSEASAKAGQLFGFLRRRNPEKPPSISAEDLSLSPEERKVKKAAAVVAATEAARVKKERIAELQKDLNQSRPDFIRAHPRRGAQRPRVNNEALTPEQQVAQREYNVKLDDYEGYKAQQEHLSALRQKAAQAEHKVTATRERVEKARAAQEAARILLEERESASKVASSKAREIEGQNQYAIARTAFVNASIAKRRSDRAAATVDAAEKELFRRKKRLAAAQDRISDLPDVQRRAASEAAEAQEQFKAAREAHQTAVKNLDFQGSLDPKGVYRNTRVEELRKADANLKKKAASFERAHSFFKEVTSKNSIEDIHSELDEAQARVEEIKASRDQAQVNSVARFEEFREKDAHFKSVSTEPLRLQLQGEDAAGTLPKTIEANQPVIVRDGKVIGPGGAARAKGVKRLGRLHRAAVIVEQRARVAFEASEKETAAAEEAAAQVAEEEAVQARIEAEAFAQHFASLPKVKAPARPKVATPAKRVPRKTAAKVEDITEAQVEERLAKFTARIASISEKIAQISADASGEVSEDIKELQAQKEQMEGVLEALNAPAGTKTGPTKASFIPAADVADAAKNARTASTGRSRRNTGKLKAVLAQQAAAPEEQRASFDAAIAALRVSQTERETGQTAAATNGGVKLPPGVTRGGLDEDGFRLSDSDGITRLAKGDSASLRSKESAPTPHVDLPGPPRVRKTAEPVEVSPAPRRRTSKAIRAADAARAAHPHLKAFEDELAQRSQESAAAGSALEASLNAIIGGTPTVTPALRTPLPVGRIDLSPPDATVNTATASKAKRESQKGSLQAVRAKIIAADKIIKDVSASADAKLAAAEELLSLYDQRDTLSATRDPAAAAAKAATKAAAPPATSPQARAQATATRLDDRSKLGKNQGIDVVTGKRENLSNDPRLSGGFEGLASLLSKETQAALVDIAARKKLAEALTGEARAAEINALATEAAARIITDPNYSKLRSGGPGSERSAARGLLASTLGLETGTNRQLSFDAFENARKGAAQNLRNGAGGGGGGTNIPPSGAGDEDGGTVGIGLLGKGGGRIIDRALNRIGHSVSNLFGFQLAFSGFEKLKELVETGLQADVTFVRLNATLQASGRSSQGLRTAFSKISSETGEDLKKVVGAAAELAGVFSNNADLVKGTEIAAQLANISQGTLNAKEAAIGLRDVTDAYAVEGSAGIQAIGDQIARLSVVTGVSVKDITEGATQLAQEAHEFGLSQRQAVVLTTFVTKNTGESGEQAAEQTSRLLSTLTTGKVQDALVKFKVATREQFASGDIAGVLTNLLQNFDKLPPSAKQAIQSLVGAGRQARAFTGLIRDGSNIVDEFNNSQGDLGALAKQNSAILGTIAGNIKKFGEDFRNAGQTLEQLGLFNLLGAVAKAADLVAVAFNFLGQSLADALNSNPLTKDLKNLIILLAEASIAFKLFRVVGSQAFAKIGGNLGIGGGARGPVYGPALPPQLAAQRAFQQDLASRNRFSRFAPNALSGATGFLGRGLAGTGNILGGVGGTGAVGRGVQGVGRAATAAGSGLQRLSLGIRGLGASSIAGALATTALSAALTGLLVGLPFFISSIQKARERGREGKQFQDSLVGISSDDKNDPIKQGADVVTQGDRAKSARGDSFADVVKGSVSNTLNTLLPFGLSQGLGGSGPSKGDTSNKFDKDFEELTRRQFGRLRGTKGKSADDIKNIQKVNDEEFKNSVEKLIGEAGDEEAQETARAELGQLQQSLTNSGQKRLEIAKGLLGVDILNAKQIAGIGTLVQSSSTQSKQSLQDVGGLLNELKSDSGIAGGSKADENFKVSIDPNATATDRRRAEIDNLKDAIAQGTDLLRSGFYASGQSRDALIQTLNSESQQLQQLQQQEIQTNIALGQAESDFLSKTGNPEASTTAIKGTINGIIASLAFLDASQPEYFQALSQLLDAEQKQAEILGTKTINKLKINSSTTLDPVRRAQNELKTAQENLKNLKTTTADGDSKAIADAQSKFNAADANFSNLQRKGTLLAALDGDTSPAASPQALKAAKDARETAKQALNALKGSTADQNPQVIAAQIAVNEAKIQAAQAAADKALSSTQLTTALLENAGNSAGAAKSELIGLQGELGDGGTLAAAIKNYGDDSAQANAVRIQIIAAKKKIDDAFVDTLNAALDLEIASLDARGAKGDAEKAAADKTKEVQNQIDAYKKRTGDKGLKNPEGERLAASLVTAKRSQFDTALQAQLDTLDFQKETFQITSAQEVAALQSILKNKQLTLKEQRDITSKIRGLQQSIRQQLTGGGFNIPTDIKLPSVYEVRRSLGAGFNSRGTTTIDSSVTNQNRVQIVVQVPNAQVASAVVDAATSQFNSDTARSVRANSSTPRLVSLR